MLKRRLALLAGVSTMVAIASLTSAPPAAADYVYCPPAGGPCIVVVTTPGAGGGGGGGGGGAGGCAWHGQPVDCFVQGWGWYDGVRCYYRPFDPPPLPGDPLWRGHKPGDGAVYIGHCLTQGATGPEVGVVPEFPWFAQPPAQAVSPAALAARAINLLGLTGPQIGIVPKPGSRGGLVGLPVWLWTQVGRTTWGPNSATASVPGLSVIATSKASKIVWDLGDRHLVSCDNPGVPYTAAYGKQSSPKCGYSYSTPGTYRVTGTTYWHVTWVGGGQQGSLDVQRSSSVQIKIGELQVLVQ